MTDFLDTLVMDTKKTISEGYYQISHKIHHTPCSLKQSILKFPYAPIIGEIKQISPSHGVLKENIDIEKLIFNMRKGGVVGISILTEPKHFRGSIHTFIQARKSATIPLLMKDIILCSAQIDTASAIGADAILLITTLFNRGYCERNLSEMIHYAHSKGIEVLLETHTKAEFVSVLDTEADIIGINNRDLKTLKVNLQTTKKVLQYLNHGERIIVSESGIQEPSDIRFLSAAGATAFLVGSAIMKADDIKGKVRELVRAI